MNLKKTLLVLFLALIIIAGAVFVYFNYFNSFDSVEETFKSENVLIKSVTNEGTKLSSSFSITNLGEAREINIKAINLDNFVILNQTNFYLEDKEIKKINFLFDTSSIKPGIYTGSFFLTDGIYEKSIPVILEVQTSNKIFAVNLEVNPEYTDLEVGEEGFLGVSLFNLKDKKTHNINVTYLIRDVYGRTVLNEQENLVVDSEYIFTKSFSITEKFDKGQYIFSIKVDVDGTTSTSSYLLNIYKKRISFPFDAEFYSTIVMVVLLLIVMIVFYLFYERRKLFSSIRKQHSSQVKNYAKYIDKKKRESIAKAKTKKEKEKILRNFNDAKKKILKEMRSEQKKQKKEFKKLNKKEDCDKVQKKLHSWEKEVYPKALKAAHIDQKLKSKLSTLKQAYSEGYIKKESYEKGKSRIVSAKRKLSSEE